MDLDEKEIEHMFGEKFKKEIIEWCIFNDMPMPSGIPELSDLLDAIEMRTMIRVFDRVLFDPSINKDGSEIIYVKTILKIREAMVNGF
jgi:hypothetical protein